MKKMAFVLSFLCCSLLIYPQTMNSGSAKTLEGNIYVLTCFISNSSVYINDFHAGRWDHRAKISILQQKNSTLNWLKEQAREYGIAIDFIEDVMGLEEDISDVVPSSSSGNHFNFILNSIGYNTESFYDYVKNNKNCDNFLVLLLAPSTMLDIGGLAFPVQNASPNPYVEGVVIYCGQRSGETWFSYAPNIDRTIAHEILHCFGAWDLYGPVPFNRGVRGVGGVDGNNSTGARTARTRFPNSIMMSGGPLRYDPLFSRNRSDIAGIDLITAWRIGWNKNPEPWFYECDPGN